MGALWPAVAVAAVAAVVVPWPVLTVLGARRRGASWPVAVLAGLVFPVTWAAWYLKDELSAT